MIRMIRTKAIALTITDNNDNNNDDNNDSLPPRVQDARYDAGELQGDEKKHYEAITCI